MAKAPAETPIPLKKRHLPLEYGDHVVLARDIAVGGGGLIFPSGTPGIVQSYVPGAEVWFSQDLIENFVGEAWVRVGNSIIKVPATALGMWRFYWQSKNKKRKY